MKVGYVYDALYPYAKAGVEKRVFELSKRLSARGHDVHLFSMKYWSGPAVQKRDGVTLHGVCAPGSFRNRRERTIFETVFFGYSTILPLISEDLDVIDCQSPPYIPCLPTKTHSVVKKTPLIITWHGIWGDAWDGYPGWRGAVGKTVERWVGELTDHIITVSPLTKWDLYDLGVRKKIEVIPNGIDYQHIQKVPASSLASDVIFAGSLIRERNVDVFIRALAMIRKEIPTITGVIVGGGPEIRRLKEMVHDLGLDTAVTFTEFLENQDDVIAAMKASKVFVLPSTREGYGIAALEAMACGLPVITGNDQQNTARNLINGRNGLLCQLLPEDMAEKIRMALGSPGNATIACRETARAHDWDEIVDRIEKYYCKVIDQHV
jgi:L-malate glycosyltransferase